jgi:hypothetical protein
METFDVTSATDSIRCSPIDARAHGKPNGRVGTSSNVGDVATAPCATGEIRLS